MGSGPEWTFTFGEISSASPTSPPEIQILTSSPKILVKRPKYNYKPKGLNFSLKAQILARGQKHSIKSKFQPPGLYPSLKSQIPAWRPKSQSSFDISHMAQITALKPESQPQSTNFSHGSNLGLVVQIVALRPYDSLFPHEPKLLLPLSPAHLHVH